MKNTSRLLMTCVGLACFLQGGFFGTDCLATPPAVPTGVKASNGSSDGYGMRKVVVVTCDNYGYYGEFRVWRNISADTSTATQVGATYGYSVGFDDTNVVRGVVYYYWVKVVVSGEASDFSAPDAGYAEALPVPTGVQASDVYLNNVRVTWSYPDGYYGIVTNYSVWRSTNNSTAAAELIGMSGGNLFGLLTVFTDTNVVRGVVYYYWVRAMENGGGESGFSAPDTGKTRLLSVINDFDGDGRSDVVVYRDGYWSIYSMAGYVICQNAGPWGGEGYLPVPGDYDGDGKFDAAVVEWYYGWSIYSMSRGILFNNFGGSTIFLQGIYAPGDYNGDGNYEFAVYNNTDASASSSWTITTTDYAGETINWGSKYDIPVPGDYDGDGKYDFTVYRDGCWSIYSKANGVICNNAGPWGGENWIPVPGDYDGDGKSDMAVYRDGYWSIYSTANGIICYNAGIWGGESWIPVPGDYDGDGKSDLALYRDGYWSIYSIANGIICYNAGIWGGIGYIPLGTGLRQFHSTYLIDDLSDIIHASGYSAAARFVAKTVQIGDMLDTGKYGVRTIIDVDIYDGTVGRYIKGDGYSKPGARYTYMIYGPASGNPLFIAYFSLY